MIPTERRLIITKKRSSPKRTASHLERLVLHSLDAQKAEDIVSVDLRGKSDFADCMILASATSSRHVASLADRVEDALKLAGIDPVRIEGKEGCDWVLVDGGDIVVHIFRPEARRYYNLEKMWSVGATQQLEAVH